MKIKWTKNRDGIYESQTQFWDSEALEHRPMYMIAGHKTSITHIIVKGKVEKILYGHVGALKKAKEVVQNLDDDARYNTPYLTDLDRAMALPNAHIGIGAVSITAEGKGVHWYVDENGETVEVKS